MPELYSIYDQFLNAFPSFLHGWISLVLAVLLVISVYKVLKRNFIFLILLIILLPASVPILKNIWESLVTLIKFLLTKR